MLIPPHAVYLENSLSLSRLFLTHFLALSHSHSLTHTHLGRSLSLSLPQTHWVDDEEALPVAANTIKTYAVSALVREENGFLASHRAAVHMEIAKTNAQQPLQEAAIRAAEEARQEEERRKKEQEDIARQEEDQRQQEQEDELERRRESKRLEEEALAPRRAEKEERREHQVPPSLH
jgi:hypothetical protein